MDNEALADFGRKRAFDCGNDDNYPINFKL